MTYKQIPAKPIAPNDETNLRWNENALRKRLLSGEYEQDLEDELYRHLPSDRREAWGVTDMSSNPMEQVTRQLSVLYHENPIVTNPEDISELVSREGYMTKSGIWSMMQRVQQLTLGIRETIVRIDVSPKGTRTEGIIYRVVTPDFVYIESSEDNPEIPLYYQELRLRFDETKQEYSWVADIMDIRDENNPKFYLRKVEPNGELGEDVSSIFMEKAMLGTEYPFRDKENRPYLPIVIYHAQKTGKLWNSFDCQTLISGSLSSMVLFSFWLHVVRDCSWVQRYATNVFVSGLTQNSLDEPARRSSISTDPSSILIFSQDPDINTQPVIGQFQAGADPEKLLQAVASYEYRVAVSCGISPSELTRTSSDPRSGYSLSVSRQGQRESSRSYAPIFRLCDEELCRKTAMLCNRYLGTSLPESGYRVSYQALEYSPEEKEAIRKDVIEKLAASLISPIDAIRQLNPDMDEEEARETLLRIRREKAEFL